ncbi:unnamed protein product [Ranitomeya imitator]|uniref:Uncharacterized protein n=1 Tax=Ranitomeya imitator TaxID=111125 RepID=A0ABN9MFL3_9NEOB|nr:unnamed protein product [Ranitomeya imitator]
MTCCGVLRTGVEKHCIRGLQWPQVFPEIIDIAREAKGPIILVLHAGRNDLCFYKLAELMTMIRFDKELEMVWPLNGTGGQSMPEYQNLQKQLKGDNVALLRPDGVHLTDIGLDIFLSGLQSDNRSLFPCGVY